MTLRLFNRAANNSRSSDIGQPNFVSFRKNPTMSGEFFYRKSFYGKEE